MIGAKSSTAIAILIDLAGMGAEWKSDKLDEP
jgi:hypothetical protein